MGGQAMTVDKAFRGFGEMFPRKKNRDPQITGNALDLLILRSPRHFVSYLIFYDSIRPTF